MLSVVLARLVRRYCGERGKGSRAASASTIDSPLHESQECVLDRMYVFFDYRRHRVQHLSIAFTHSQLWQLLPCPSISGTSAHGGEEATLRQRVTELVHRGHIDHLAIHHQLKSVNTICLHARSIYGANSHRGQPTSRMTSWSCSRQPYAAHDSSQSHCSRQRCDSLTK